MILTDVLNLVNAGYSKTDIEKLENDVVEENTVVDKPHTDKPHTDKPSEQVANGAIDYKALAKAMIDAQQEYNRATDYSKNNPKVDIGKFF